MIRKLVIVLAFLLRLLLLGGMFAGIFLLVQWPSLALGLAGMGLILLTPVLNIMLVGWVNRPAEFDRSEAVDAARLLLPILVPGVLFVVFLLAIPFLLDQFRDHLAGRFEPGHGSILLALLLLGFILCVLPVILVFKDALGGRVPCTAAALGDAYGRQVAELCAIALTGLVAVLGAVLPIGVGVFGSVMLLITLGDLGWQWLEPGSDPGGLRPYFCREFELGRGAECGMKLGGMHVLQLVALVVMIRYGEPMLDWAARLIARMRAYAAVG